MIVCSCNALSDKEILSTLRSEDAARPRSAAQAYRCLGCAPRCGRCLTTVRALLASARGTECQVGCAVCPGAQHDKHGHAHEEVAAPFLLAAE